MGPVNTIGRRWKILMTQISLFQNINKNFFKRLVCLFNVKFNSRRCSWTSLFWYEHNTVPRKGKTKMPKFPIFCQFQGNFFLLKIGWNEFFLFIFEMLPEKEVLWIYSFGLEWNIFILPFLDTPFTKNYLGDLFRI